MPPSRVGELIEAAATRLRESGYPDLDAELLFRGVSGMGRADVLSGTNEPVSDQIAQAFWSAVARRERHEPVQYILGVAAFWRDEFVVSEAVLIPRPDTETLVEAVSSRLSPAPDPRILDLGTGSGCIALSLLRELPGARVLAVDISPAALEVAALNARRTGRSDRIEFRASDWFDRIEATETFDAIVSNPPYVSPADRSRLPAEVRSFEPARALYAEPSDDLSSYRSILAKAARHLNRDGLLAVEVGAGQASRVADLFIGAGFRTPEILEDLARIQRLVLGRHG